jgi:hypothetical protein
MPFTIWRTYRKRAQQKRKVLQMLVVSGVVRPCDVELRYTIPLLRIRASNGSPGARPTSTTTVPALRQPSSTNTKKGEPQLFRWLAWS